MAKVAPAAVDNVDVPLEESPPPKAGRRKFILIAIAALCLLGAAAAAWHVTRDSEADDTEAADAGTAVPKAVQNAKDKRSDKSQEGKPSVYMNLETLTVNLQGSGSDRYLQTTIVFELSDDKIAEVVKAKMPVIRSKLLLLLSAKTAAELNLPGGKESLAVEIMNEARKHFASSPPEQVLLNVHFNAFVIQ